MNNWEDRYLGKRVTFKLNNHKMVGVVKATEEHFLANGKHQIVEIELEKEQKQVKIQMHRQAVKIIY